MSNRFLKLYKILIYIMLVISIVWVLPNIITAICIILALGGDTIHNDKIQMIHFIIFILCLIIPYVFSLLLFIFTLKSIKNDLYNTNISTRNRIIHWLTIILLPIYIIFLIFTFSHARILFTILLTQLRNF